MPAWTTPLLRPVWWRATASSFSRTVTVASGRSSPSRRATASPMIPAPTTPIRIAPISTWKRSPWTAPRRPRRLPWQTHDASRGRPRAARRLVPRPARDRRRRLGRARRAGREHRLLGAALDGSRGRDVLPPDGLPPRGPQGGAGARRGAARRGRRGVRDELAPDGGEGAEADGHLRLEGGPLPVRPALALAARRAADGPRRRGLEPPRPRDVGDGARPPVPPHPCHARNEGGRRAAAARPLRGQDRPRDPGALHADPLAVVPRGDRRADHQHPPLVPAGVRRPEPVPARLRARRQADRGDRALRDRRPGRGAD